MSIDAKLENPQGKLLVVARQVDLSTVQHACEIQKDRLTDMTLRDMSFWTADFPLYTMEDREGKFDLNGDVFLYLADRKHNLAFQHIDDAVADIKANDNFFPDDSDIGSVINAKSTLRVRVNDLGLQGTDDEWLYFEIDTKNYSKMDKFQRPVAERVHGKGRVLDRTMKMLSDEGKEKTSVGILNPKYVQKKLQEHGKQSLARVFALDSFVNNSVASAGSRDVDDYGGRLRGVLLTSVAGKQEIIAPKFYDISQVIAESSRESSFAPDQIKIMQNILEQNNYKIIKGESR